MNGLPVHVFNGQCINPTLHLSCRNVSSIVKIFIQSIMCTEPHEVSLLSLLWYVHSGGGIEVMSEVRRGAQVRKIFVLCKGDKSHSFLDNLSLSQGQFPPSSLFPSQLIRTVLHNLAVSVLGTKICWWLPAGVS